jgi:carboxypeptidase C (cathepsin A)
MPTWQRLRDTYWNTRSSRIFTDKPVGVGWSVNVAALLKRFNVLGGQDSGTRV